MPRRCGMQVPSLPGVLVAGWLHFDQGSIMKNLTRAVQKFFDDERGLTAIEYGLIAAVLVVAVIVTVSLVAQQLDATYVGVKNCVLSPSTCK